MQRNALPGPIQVDSSAAIKMTIGASMYQEEAVMARMDVWHKVIVLRGAHFGKDVVLKAVLNTVEPADLIPVKYQISGEDTFFLVRNCGPALEKLCRSSLIIKTSDGQPLILLLTLAFATLQDIKVNIQSLLLAALTRRYDPNKRSLNLENFHEEPDISKTAYCPLTQHRTFQHVLKLAGNALASFDYLNLQNNELMNLQPLETVKLASVKYLDLRHNQLMNMDVLAPLAKGNYEITKLWLDDNPVCENYSSAKQYIESVKKYCPKLVELDGVCVGTPNEWSIKNNYCKDVTRIKLVDQFVTHFFKLYDSGDRSMLKGLYHHDAFYSLSFGIPLNLAHTKKLGQFTACRNILKFKDASKRSQHLYHGDENVLLGLKKLPRSYHDKSTFLCDLMYDDGKCLVLSVQGLFKNMHGDSPILSFCRTFVLLACEDNEYKISNDQYHVDAAPDGTTPGTVQAKTSYEEIVPACFNKKEKTELTANMGEITMLNEEWCLTYLEETHWDLRKAIMNFMKDLKSSAVPPEAFQK